MLIVGESLNSSIPFVGQAVIHRDEKTLQDLARKQVECGAQALDVNAGGLAGQDECANLIWMVELIQRTVPVPLVLDSTNPEPLREAMSIYRGQPILSSATAEKARLDALLPLAREYHCGLLALCMDENGIPPEAEGRIKIASYIVERVTDAGIKPENLYLDPMVMTIGSDTMAGTITLQTLQGLHEHFPHVSTICGVSNVGYGMPKRKLLNRTFIAMLMAYGLDVFMTDVRDQELMAVYRAAAALTGRDTWGREYLKAFRAGKLESKVSST